MDIKLRLTKFCDAIRAKREWTFKILDDGLAKKWAAEAQLLAEGEELGDETATVTATIRELQAEARRIQIMDFKLYQGQGLPLREIDLSKMDAEIRNALKYTRVAKYALQAPALKEDVGALISDGIVPPSLHRELSAELDRLAALDPQDFHPGTHGKVQDLIHPSLYPYVAGVTAVSGSVDLPMLIDGKFITTRTTTTNRSESVSHTYESRYSWIPSIFTVSPDGKSVSIDSYINGLGPRESFPNLYDLIERVFLFALPHFERTLAFKYEYKCSQSVERWKKRKRYVRTRAEWNEQLVAQAEEKHRQLEAQKVEEKMLATEIAEERSNITQFFQADESSLASDWRGHKLKVIVKAANYILEPGQEYEGTWHMEGMPHERITASVIYYYHADPEIEDKGLCMRRQRALRDFPDLDQVHSDQFYISRPLRDGEEEESDGEDYPSDWEMDINSASNPTPMRTYALHSHIPVGTIPTTNLTSSHIAQSARTGRMLSFPNWIQHKVEGVKNTATVNLNGNPQGKVAKRKILCFFLVQDDDVENDEVEYHGFRYGGLKNKVLTTGDIPNQHRGMILPTLDCLLAMVCQKLTKKNLPLELRAHILALANFGMTREEAERHRRALMNDRKPQPNDGE